MSGALDATMVPLCLRLIQNFGVTCDFEQKTAGTHNDDTLVETPGVSVRTVDVPVLVDTYGASAIFKGNASNVLTGDKRLWVPGASLDTAPVPADEVTLVGKVWRVISVAEIWSGAQIALYDVQVRKGG